MEAAVEARERRSPQAPDPPCSVRAQWFRADAGASPTERKRAQRPGCVLQAGGPRFEPGTAHSARGPLRRGFAVAHRTAPHRAPPRARVEACWKRDARQRSPGRRKRRRVSGGVSASLNAASPAARRRARPCALGRDSPRVGTTLAHRTVEEPADRPPQGPEHDERRHHGAGRSRSERWHRRRRRGTRDSAIRPRTDRADPPTSGSSRPCRAAGRSSRRRLRAP